MKFSPPPKIKPEDVPDVITTDRGEFTIDVSKVKDSFTGFLNMADFLKDTTLTCKDCCEFPCHRNQDPDQKIGFCYEIEDPEETRKTHYGSRQLLIYPFVHPPRTLGSLAAAGYPDG